MSGRFFFPAFFIGVFILFSSITSHSQGLYTSVSGGYNAKLGGETIGNVTSTSFQSTSYSLGRGLSGELAVGYYFTEHIGIELGFGYLKSSKKEINLVGPLNYSEVDKADYMSSTLRLNPSLVITTGNGRVKPYAKLGMTLAKGSIRYHFTQNQQVAQQNQLIEQTWEYSKGLGLGVKAGMGILVSLSEKRIF